MRKKDEEKITDAGIERVIAYLETKGATKKGACEILNIAYNTARLDKLINVYKDKKAFEADRRAKNRGKPASENEIGFVIEGYLQGRSIESLADSIFRSRQFVVGILSRFNVPPKAKAYSYFKPELVPEYAMRDEFRDGQIVYSMRYDCLAKVKYKYKNAYAIWVMSDTDGCNAYQPAEELADLSHLKPYLGSLNV